MKNSSILLVGTETFQTSPLAAVLRRAGHRVTEVLDTDCAIAALYGDINSPFEFLVCPTRVGPMNLIDFLHNAKPFLSATILLYGGHLTDAMRETADQFIYQGEPDATEQLLEMVENWNHQVSQIAA